MKINTSPIKTSNNFRINDFEIDESLFKKGLKKYDSFKLENITLKEINKKVNTKYGINNNQINSANFKYELEIIDNSKYGIIDFNINEDLVDLIEINVKTSSNYLIKYSSKNESYHNGLIKVNISKDAKANIIVVNDMSKTSTNLISFDNTCDENSNLNYLIVDLGGNISVSNYYSKLIKNNAKNNLNSIYIGNGKQKFDINYIIEIFAQNCNCNIDVQGSLSSESRKSFKGTIDFKKGCKKSKGNENEYCILMSNKAISKSLPILLCSEEDVIGNHSTASGKINEKTLFYILSRGISKKDAEKLIVKSHLNRLTDMINDSNVRDKIEKIIDKKL